MSHRPTSRCHQWPDCLRASGAVRPATCLTSIRKAGLLRQPRGFERVVERHVEGDLEDLAVLEPQRMALSKFRSHAAALALSPEAHGHGRAILALDDALRVEVKRLPWAADRLPEGAHAVVAAIDPCQVRE